MTGKTMNRSRAGNAAAFLFLAVFGVFIALPMYYSVINAFKPISELFLFPPRFVVYHPTLQNFAEILRVQSQSLIPVERYVLSFREEELNWIRSLIGDEIVSKSLKTGVISIPSKRRDYIEALLNKLLFENEGQDILSPAFIQAGLLELLLFMIRCQQY